MTQPKFPLDTIFAVEENAFRQALTALRQQSRGVPFRTQPPLTFADNIAIVDVEGILTKRPSVFQQLFGGSSTLEIQEAVENATRADNVDGVVLRVDSPGGAAAAIPELADTIFAARQVKPIIAQVNGTAASAALFIASQAHEVYATRSSLAGSVGTRMLVHDCSENFADEGIKAIPIDTGEFKSAGALGTKVTERHIEHFQEVVNAINAQFLDALKRGRNLTDARLRSISDGRIFTAAQSVQNGLIDAIQTEAETLAKLRARLDAKQRVPAPATLASLETDWRKAVENTRSQMQSGKRLQITTAQAMAAAQRKYPNLHKRFVDEHNAKRKARR